MVDNCIVKRYKSLCHLLHLIAPCWAQWHNFWFTSQKIGPMSWFVVANITLQCWFLN